MNKTKLIHVEGMLGLSTKEYEKTHGVLCEVDEITNFNSLIKISDLIYHIRSAVPNCDGGYSVAIVEKVDANFENKETNFQNNIKCPFCGYEDEDSWEMNDEVDDEYICRNCMSELIVNRHISILYSAELIKIPDIYEVEREDL